MLSINKRIPNQGHWINPTIMPLGLGLKLDAASILIPRASSCVRSICWQLTFQAYQRRGSSPESCRKAELLLAGTHHRIPASLPTLVADHRLSQVKFGFWLQRRNTSGSTNYGYRTRSYVLKSTYFECSESQKDDGSSTMNEIVLLYL